MREGIDVSKWQGEMDWDQAKRAGARFAIIRAGSIDNVSGVPYTDYQFERNSNMAPGLMPVGYYWFFRPNHSANKQANYFTNLILDKRRDLPAVCDIEVRGDASGVQRFCESVSGALGERVMIYTSPNAWRNYLTGDKSWALNYPLWIAHWGVMAPTILDPWLEYAAWQYEVGNDGFEYGAQSTRIDHDLAQDWLFNGQPPPVPSEEFVVANCTWLNGRSEPDSSVDNKVVTLRAGQKVSLVEDGGTWKKVRLDNVVGWMHGYYLKELEE